MNPMHTGTVNMSIIDELSEYITLRMSSYLEQTHDSHWVEHKSHSDYDLWFITAGSIKIIIDGIEHIADPGDVVFFIQICPILLPRLKSADSYTYTLISALLSKSEFWASFNCRASYQATLFGRNQRCSPHPIEGSSRTAALPEVHSI